MLNVKNNIYKKFTKTHKAPSFKMRLYKRKQKRTRKFNKLKCSPYQYRPRIERFYMLFKKQFTSV